MDRINVGVIGAGFMGGVHARAIAESPQAVVKAVADPAEERAQALATRYGATPYASHGDMLAAESLQAVVVCTPETHHRAPVVDAAAHGCAVLVEKPLAATLADADAMIAACHEHGVPLMVGYLLRFEPAYAKIKEAVAAGMIGRLLSAYARRNAPIGEGRRIGGRTSVITYLMVHDADQLLWYNPSPVVRVTAKAVHGKLSEEIGIADFTWSLLEFADGSLGVIESGWGLTEKWADWSQPENWFGFGDVEMNVIGTEGVLALDFTPMNLAAVDAREGWKFPETRHWPVINGRLGGALRMEMNHFLECVVSGEIPLIDGGEGRRSLELAIAAEQSIAQGQAIVLPLG
jgi:predicted dehydrogenase